MNKCTDWSARLQSVLDTPVLDVARPRLALEPHAVDDLRAVVAELLLARLDVGELVAGRLRFAYRLERGGLGGEAAAVDFLPGAVLVAFFDFPGLDLGPYLETLGNVNHIAISVTRDKWEYLRGKLDAAGVEYHTASGTSIYFKDPDGVRLELLADPFGEMYGTKVL